MWKNDEQLLWDFSLFSEMYMLPAIQQQILKIEGYSNKKRKNKSDINEYIIISKIGMPKCQSPLVVLEQKQP